MKLTDTIRQIISGGQTGVDQAGLLAAREAGIPTGGTAPKGYLTEDGPAPWLKDYGLTESAFSTYTNRTRLNVKDADYTLIIGDWRSAGSRKTMSYCREFGKQTYSLDTTAVSADTDSHAKELSKVLRSQSDALQRPLIVNVAGNRESRNPGIGEATKSFLLKVFHNLDQHWAEDIADSRDAAILYELAEATTLGPDGTITYTVTWNTLPRDSE